MPQLAEARPVHGLPPAPIRERPGRLRPGPGANRWRRAGSNRRALECHSSALPTELRPRRRSGNPPSNAGAKGGTGPARRKQKTPPPPTRVSGFVVLDAVDDLGHVGFVLAEFRGVLDEAGGVRIATRLPSWLSSTAWTRSRSARMSARSSLAPRAARRSVRSFLSIGARNERKTWMPTRPSVGEGRAGSESNRREHPFRSTGVMVTARWKGGPGNRGRPVSGSSQRCLH